MRLKMRSRRFNMEAMADDDAVEESIEESNDNDDELLVEKIARRDKLPTEVADSAALASEREEIREEIEEAMDSEETSLDDAEDQVDDEEDPKGIEDTIETDEDTDDLDEVSQESLKLRSINEPLRAFHSDYVKSIQAHAGPRGCLSFEDLSSSYTKDALLESAQRLLSSIKGLASQFEEKTQKVYDGLKKANEDLAVLETLHEKDQSIFDSNPVIKRDLKIALIPMAIGDEFNQTAACQQWTDLIAFLNITIKNLSELQPTDMASYLRKNGFEEVENKALVHKNEYPGGSFLHVRVDLPLNALTVETEVNEVFFVRRFGPAQIDALPSRLEMESKNAQGAFYATHILCENTVKSMESKHFIYPLVNSLTECTNELIEKLQPEAHNTNESQDRLYEQLRLCFEKYVQLLILTDLYLKTTNQLQEAVFAARRYIETFIQIKT